MMPPYEPQPWERGPHPDKFLPPVVGSEGEAAPSKSKVKPRKSNKNRNRRKHGR